MRILIVQRLMPGPGRERSAGWLHSGYSSRFFASHDTPSSEQRVHITWTDNNRVAHVQLCRPHKLNALDMGMFRSISHAARQLQSDKNLRCVILSGQGKGFCSGLDVKSVIVGKNYGLSAARNMQELLAPVTPDAISNLAQDVAYLWRQVPVPVICAIHGVCFGGGLQMALGADVRLATPDAKLSIMETKWGLIPDMSLCVTLRELVRADIAKELTWTGRIVSGTEAADLGLVTRTCDDPLAAAQQMARQILERSPDAVALGKQLMQSTHSTGMSERSCLALEKRLQQQLLPSWNQMASAARNVGVTLPYRAAAERNDDLMDGLMRDDSEANVEHGTSTDSDNKSPSTK